MRRRAPAIPLAALIVLCLAVPALAAVTWLDPTAEHPRVGQRYTWNYGSSLGKTADGRLHTAYTTDFVDGTWASDTGPYQGVYYHRGTVGTGDAVSWSTARRVSQTSRHADRSVVTAGGSLVAVGWVTHASYDRYKPSDPRVFFWRVNTRSGAGTAWLSPVRISSSTGRVDYPVLATNGTNLYAAYTNSDNGAVIFVRDTNPSDSAFERLRLGVTDHKDSDDPAEGFGGWPGICANGNLVGVAWLDDPDGPTGPDDGAVVARVSTDGGATFGSVVTLEPKNGHRNSSWPQCAANAATNRIVFVWTTPAAVRYAVFTGSTPGTPGTVANFSSLGAYNGGYGPAPEFAPDGSKVGIAIPACKDTALTNDCNYYSTQARIEQFWTEGTIGSWPTPVKIAAVSKNRPKITINDSPSVVWYDADTRFVTYNAWEPKYSRYEIQLQTGEGV
jgi:hypothetical protein